MNARTIQAIGLGLTLAVGCNKGPSMRDALEETAKKDQEAKAAEEAKKAAVKVEKDPNALEFPWTIDAVKSALPMGTSLLYQVTGTDEKGKKVEDQYKATVVGTKDMSVGIIEFPGRDADKPSSQQVANVEWSKLSPFFGLERATSELSGKESVTVPAGTFDCVVAEIHGFFGGHRTVWMIKDKPGVYAKVVDHGNANEPDSKLQLTYELEKTEVVK